MSTTARRFYGENLFTFHVVVDLPETELGIARTSTWSFLEDNERRWEGRT
jgi:hypothetical protein